jgi:cytochrome c oxidase cbb3-type subunit III
MKNSILTKHKLTICLLFATAAFVPMEVSAAGETVPGAFAHNLENMFLLFGAFIILAVIAFLAKFVFILMEVQKQRYYLERGLEYPLREKKQSFWEQLYQKSTAYVPVAQEADIMLDHNYDGIRELDNNLPPWWVAMFYITIFVGGVYFLYYHYFDYGQLMAEEYALEMKYGEEEKARAMEKQANLVNESTVQALTDEKSLAGGATIFKASCVQCHGQAGEGNAVGPNLTDDYWIHGGGIKSVFKTIKYGVPQKGMIAWKDQLNAASMHQVASYIVSLHGTNPPNAKAPQGELYKPE